MFDAYKFPKNPKPLRRLPAVVEQKEQPFYPRDEVYMSGLLPRSDYNYGHDIKEGLDSNVIMAPVFWVMRTFVEAQLVVQSKRARDMWENRPDHDLEILIDEPNPFYGGDALWQATVISYILDGNGYWLKMRNRYGEVVQLWYAPHWAIRPKWAHEDGAAFISHYEYSPGGTVTQMLDPRDVVHFRFGIDPRNPRMGLGCLRPLLREVFSDEEAAAFSATILTNMGVPGLIISPEEPMTKEQAEEFHAHIQAHHTGDARGGTLVLGRKAGVHSFGHDPNKLMLANLRDITEERVCATIGIPAAVVGFGSGLQSTKVGATMRELMKAAWTTCLIPMQTSMGKQVTTSLLPDFVSQKRMFRAAFDRTNVSALQEEQSEKTNRAATLVGAGILRVDRAQEMCGLEVDSTQQVYLRPTASQPVGDDGEPIPSEARGRRAHPVSDHKSAQWCSSNERQRERS